MKNYPMAMFYVTRSINSKAGCFDVLIASGKIVQYGNYSFGVSYRKTHDYYEIVDLSTGIVVGKNSENIKFRSEDEAISAINDELVKVITEKYETMIFLPKLREHISRLYERR